MAQPFVVILVIAAAGSVTYAFPAPGRAPVKILLLQAGRRQPSALSPSARTGQADR